MPIYHFIVDYTKEYNKYPHVSRLDTKSNILVMADTYETAFEKVKKHLEKRKYYTKNLNDYNVEIDWIEKNDEAASDPVKLTKGGRRLLPLDKYSHFE